MGLQLLETASVWSSPLWVGGGFVVAMVGILLAIVNYGKGHPHA